MDKFVITSGESFTDIDTLASTLAYEELLTKEGKVSKVVLPGVLNTSVVSEIKKWKLNYSTSVHDGVDRKYVIIDVSNPRHIASFVDQRKIVEVYDHHFGNEDYWSDNLGGRSVIESVGACATLIFEELEKRLTPLDISSLTANLLHTAIISNTLNFNASVTTTRDKAAFKKIQRFVNLPTGWTESYFLQQDAGVHGNVKGAIRNDTKVERVDNLQKTFVIGQIELWNSSEFVRENLGDIETTLESFGEQDWFLTSPSISEGLNYIVTKSKYVKNLLEENISAIFQGDIGVTSKLWLRKEILRKLQRVKID